jgi:hypothetical protein
MTAPKKQEKKKVEVDPELTRGDPFTLLGFGMVAYRNLIFTFIILFMVLSAFMTPALVYYN